MLLNKLQLPLCLASKSKTTLVLFLCLLMMAFQSLALQYELPFWSNKHDEKPMPDFAKITNVIQKKTAFFNYLRPFVDKENHKINTERTFLLSMQQQLVKGYHLSHAQARHIQSLAKQYQYKLASIGVKPLMGLLDKVGTIPFALVLIQAAKESGWGTSRFAREGHNFFGQWCYTKGCGLMPRSPSNHGYYEVKRFKSTQDSVIAYMHNLNVNGAYFLFRKIRSTQVARGKKPTAEQLVYGLVHYSQRRQAYIHELLHLLRENKRYLN
ncbi:glucosaminidase domain-containing protein [uncultured Shewanella sp.]|uniref:glucosaminidase domain-containing protein n=1 Tax=uncultured Shewanella sp. TaxID=173975 RepID=UPI002617C17C|nr:glucosaminidase domain-containing protein [uncultured Shewanella sp.]